MKICQSPKSRVCDLADNRTPSQEIRPEVQSAENSVRVFSPKKCKAFGGMRSQNRGGKI